MLDSEVFFVNSHNRLDKSDPHCDFTYNIDTHGKKYTHACILNCEIPKSYYSIQSNYNTMKVLEYDEAFDFGSPPHEFTISIPAGNYNYKTFKNALVTSLNESSFIGVTYSMTFDATTAKYTYDISGPVSHVEFHVGTNFSEHMGFTRNSVVTFHNLLDTVSTECIDVSPENTLYIRSNLTHTGKNNILCSLNASQTPPYGSIGYSCPDIEGYSIALSELSSNVFRFQLTNEDEEDDGQQLMDTNGKNIVFSLLLYRKTDLYDIIKNVVRLSLIEDT